MLPTERESCLFQRGKATTIRRFDDSTTTYARYDEKLRSTWLVVTFYDTIGIFLTIRTNLTAEIDYPIDRVLYEPVKNLATVR